MKKLSLLFSLLFIAYGSFAQSKKVALQHAGNTTLFIGNNGLVDAVNAAVSGDTIYLPGGYWTATNIGKKLVIYGAGHYPDSTQVTEATHITGGFTFVAGSDSSFIQGCDINGDVNVQSTSYVTLSRCIFNSSTITATSDYVSYNENVIRNVININNNGDFVAIRNNFFTGVGYSYAIMNVLQGALIENNIINHQSPNSGWPTFNNVNGSLIRNNIIMNPLYNGIFTGSNNLIQKNLFTVAPSYGTNSPQGNYESISATNLFVNYSSTNNFSYIEDYHLQSPATYLGTDNTQVGMYGGADPYKMASVPANPHIRENNTANQTDVNGNLNVNIKVGAQNR